MSMEIVLERIEECKKTKATELDLSGLDLYELPKEIGLLTWLTVLKLGRYKKSQRNYLSEFPPEIENLTNLQELDLSWNQLTTLPESINTLTQLQYLSLSYNQLNTLPETICALYQLRHLVLAGNQLTTLPEAISALNQLQKIDLTNNHLSSLPESISSLNQLQSLYLRNNKFTSLPESITSLTQLQSLSLAGNQLTSLPESISSLSRLRSLSLTGNQIATLPESISTLTQLQSLILKNNALSILPKSITFLNQLKLLILEGNQLSIPKEILVHPTAVTVIFDYIRATHQEQIVPLAEVKILVVGEADVGKTTLIKRLLDEPVDIAKRTATRGIEISDWNISVKERNLTLHLWDFGGQEIMHNTHRLFLTTRSCYLLVVDATQSEESNGIIKWLKTIHLYAPDAPVILVINKSDQFRLRLNLEALVEHHPIQAMVETSCLTGEGLDILYKTLENTLSSLPHLDDLIPARWMAVRQQVVGTTRDYIDYKDFQEICEANGVGKTSNSVAEILHWLGVLFTYSNDRTLKLTHVLNPNWVTEGIYPILTDQELIQRGGIVTDADIERILDPQRYPPEKHPFILGMMFNFELAFELKRGEYLVPDLLPKSAPTYTWDDKNAIRFVYQYDFLPAGLFSRFVIQMRNEVKPSEVWRTGVVLYQRGKSYALVTLNTDTQQITLAVSPTQGDPRTVLDVLRDKFEALYSTFPGLKVEEFVPISTKDVLISYADLLYWESRGEFKQSNRKAGEFNVREMLDGIAHRSSRNRRASAHRGEKWEGAKSSILSAEATSQRRKQLLVILEKAIGITAQKRDLFLESAGLERYQTKLQFDLEPRDFCLLLFKTLENAGINPDTGRPALYSLLQELLERRGDGHPDEAEFLQTWMDEIA